MGLWLVTGGAGFIGSHLVEALLARGERVRVLDDLSTGSRANVPAGVELLVGDVADAALVRQALAGVSGCFHLAAVASVQRGNEDWLGTHRSNLTGAVAVFDAAKDAAGPAPVPVAYASSAAVFGDNQDLPLTEASATGPLSAYGADKLGCELHGKVAALVHGVPTTGLRFFNVYGPRQDPKSPYSGVIAIFADRARLGQELRVNGDGGASRDFIYVTDVVRHLLAAMGRMAAAAARGEKADAEVFNVCTGRPTTILELATIIRGLAGSDSPITHGPERAGDIRLSLGNPGKARRLLGVAAETQVRDGLRATLDSLSTPA